MVLAEVARDPPSPFLTVQADCDAVVQLPSVTPAWPQSGPTAAGVVAALPSPFALAVAAGGVHHSRNSSTSSTSSGKGVPLPPPQAAAPAFQNANGSSSRRGDALQPRSHLQSIVSQQSLNFNAHPDSPLEFELALSSIAAAAGGPVEQAKHQELLAAAAAAAAAGRARAGGGGGSDGGALNGSSSTGNHGRRGGAPDAADAVLTQDSWRAKGPLGLVRHGWLRTSRSLPQAAKQQQPPSPIKGQPGPELSCSSCSALHDPQQLRHHAALSKRLRTKVNKLLAWAGSGRQSHPGAVPASPRASPARHSAAGAVVIDAAPVSSIHSPHAWPPQWQQQLFSEPPPPPRQQQQQQPQLLQAQQQRETAHSSPGVVGGTHLLRSPRASLVSSPSSCDCPFFPGRYSSAGMELGVYHSGVSPAGQAAPAAAAPCSPGLVSSLSCSVATTPSPGRIGNGATAAAGADGSVGGGGGLLTTSLSVRPPHHRHRHHRPGCPHFYEQQQQAVGYGSQNGSVYQHQQQQQQAQGQGAPHTCVSPATLQAQNSLRAALQQLESMASIKAARIMDKLGAGLLKMTSHRVLENVVLKGGAVVGKEVMRDWEFGAHLGVGASCVTRLVIERTSGRTAACKSISKQGILRSAAVKAALLAVQREVAILQAAAGHPHVVQLQGLYEDVANLHMILEWCVGGTLFSLMERCPGYRLPERAAAAATLATLEVLAHCHARGVMHRDIKPDNLLIAKPLDDPAALTPDLVKVTDFGISLPVEPSTLLQELAGTPGYMAPEVLQRSYNQAADVWSTGVMLFEMLTGRLPFPGGNSFQEYLSGMLDNEPDLACAECQGLSPGALQLVAAMLNKDPLQRPSAAQLLPHCRQWLESVSSNSQVSAGGGSLQAPQA